MSEELSDAPDLLVVKRSFSNRLRQFMSRIDNFFCTRNLLDLDFLLKLQTSGAEHSADILADADAFEVVSLHH